MLKDKERLLTNGSTDDLIEQFDNLISNMRETNTRMRSDLLDFQAARNASKKTTTSITKTESYHNADGKLVVRYFSVSEVIYG